LSVFQGNTFIITAVLSIVIFIVLILFCLFNDIVNHFIDDTRPCILFVLLIVIGCTGIDRSRVISRTRGAMRRDRA
jgi:putative Mn2+ efflux pump MntP